MSRGRHDELVVLLIGGGQEPTLDLGREAESPAAKKQPKSRVGACSATSVAGQRTRGATARLDFHEFHCALTKSSCAKALRIKLGFWGALEMVYLLLLLLIALLGLAGLYLWLELRDARALRNSIQHGPEVGEQGPSVSISWRDDDTMPAVLDIAEREVIPARRSGRQ